MENVYPLFENVKAVFLDVDGVMTDGSIQVMTNGDQVRTFNVKDGWAIRQATRSGFPVAVISAGNNEGVRKRLEYLGVQHIFLACENKMEKFDSLLKELNITAEEVAYMGDDFPDLPILKIVGLPACPADAVHEVVEVAKYISPQNGGKGAVRDFLEKILIIREL